MRVLEAAPNKIKRTVATAVAAGVGMVGLTGCGDILGGYSPPKTVSEAQVYKKEKAEIQPAMVKIGGQAIRFWNNYKNHELSRRDLASLDRSGNDYHLWITTDRHGRSFALDIDYRRKNDANSVYNVHISNDKSRKFEDGISYDMSLNPPAADTTFYYRDYGKKRKWHFFGADTDDYKPGIEALDGYDGFHENDQAEILKIAKQTAQKAENVAEVALAGQK